MMRRCCDEREWTILPLWLAVCLMAVAQGVQAQVPSGFGIAGGYPHDRQIESDPNVIVAADFESDAWRREFSGGNRPTVSVVAEDEGRAFRPLLGKALRVKVPQGEHYGASIEYGFKKRLGYEPEEVYFRYYLRFGNDWDPARGGKLPGIGGTYGRGGWGGRPSDGRNGWSARGQFDGQKGGKTPIGFYCYHADMKGRYGSSWIWEKDGLGYLENNRWYCIEQYARLNTPGQNDGTLRGWIDGKLAFERTDVRMRDVPDLKIESIWLNVYHGGKWSASSDDHLFVDNVVVAKQYIGPMAHEADVVVYGGTSGGVIAAVQAARMGKSVVLVCPDKHLGGLGWTDTGRKEVIGGLARQFYHRIWQHYQRVFEDLIAEHETYQKGLMYFIANDPRVPADGLVQNEGDIGVSPPEPYRIAYGALCPKKDECENLLVPICLSSSHIAYGSIRMEPVFMILGQSAAAAAAQAIDSNCAVQDVDYDNLRSRLLKEDQRL